MNKDQTSVHKERKGKWKTKQKDDGYNRESKPNIGALMTKGVIQSENKKLPLLSLPSPQQVQDHNAVKKKHHLLGRNH